MRKWILLLVSVFLVAGNASAALLQYDFYVIFDEVSGDVEAGKQWGSLDATIQVETKDQTLRSFMGAVTWEDETSPELYLGWRGSNPIHSKFEPAISSYFTSFGAWFSTGDWITFDFEHYAPVGADPLWHLFPTEEWSGVFLDTPSGAVYVGDLRNGRVGGPTVVSVPEPAAFSLVALGLIFLGLRRRVGSVTSVPE